MSASDDIASLREQARRLARSGDWGTLAVAINTRMIELDDRAADAYTRLAKCFLSQGNKAAAFEMYLQVLAFQPDNRIAKNAAERLKNEVVLARELARIAALDSYDEAFTLGTSASHRGEYARAIAALSRAVKLRPSSVYGWNALGRAYRHNGQPDKARHAYEQALALTSNHVSFIGLAAVERDDGNLDQALKLYQNVLSVQPNNSYALNGIAAVYSDQGNYEAAEAFFRRAAAVKTGDDVAIEGLERVYSLYLARNDRAAAEKLERYLRALSAR